MSKGKEVYDRYTKETIEVVLPNNPVIIDLLLEGLKELMPVLDQELRITPTPNQVRHNIQSAEKLIAKLIIVRLGLVNEKGILLMKLTIPEFLFLLDFIGCSINTLEGSGYFRGSIFSQFYGLFEQMKNLYLSIVTKEEVEMFLCYLNSIDFNEEATRM